MGSRLAQNIKKEIQVPINSTFLWSDSQTVISWIKSDTPSPRQFVSHRIGEILELTEVNDWRWIPSGENVADDATRCNPEIQFSPESRWYTGPLFLQLPESHWPKETCPLRVPEDEDVEKKIALLCIPREKARHVPDINRFSTWLKLIRTTAWVRRFVNNWSGISRTVGEINGKEMKESELLWWKTVQDECFGLELEYLKKGQAIPVSSRIKSLCPFIDSNGVLRLKGRTDRAAELEFGTKNPIILDRKHRFTQLLILHIHRQCAHQGIETVFNELRMNYWVINGRAAVKKAFRECPLCKIKKAQPFQPQMGLLPSERLCKQDGAFLNTGIDFFGPLMTTTMRRRVKRYGVIFTCLSLRAIHLELAPDLTTDAAINAVRRFIARRGTPASLWSDNGTNFRGADKELQKAWSEMDIERLKRTFSDKGMTWRFNPPASPHMGGVWERLVKSVKVALSTTLKEQAPKEDILLTLFAEVEFIINNRPLTHVSVDFNDPECLTPNHFLMRRRVSENVPGVFTGDFNVRRQWKLVQELSQSLWRRWVKEYLPTLTRRTKWFQKTAPIQVGDVVLVVDKDGPRNSWPLGRITNVYPSKDGQVRVVEVKTKDGIYKRPAVKICVLDVIKKDEERDPSSGEEM